MRNRLEDGILSAGRALALGFVGTAVLIGGFLGWSVLASVSGAVIATGRIEVENRNRIVEHIDGGTVEKLLVRNGDRVARGDTLLRFADARLRSEAAILAAQYAELLARRSRLVAEYRGATAIAWDEELAILAAADPKVEGIRVGEERLFRARAAVRAGEAAQLRKRIGQAQDEITGIKARAASLDEQGGLIARELKALRTLFEKGLSRLPRLLALERMARSLEAESGATAARIAQVHGRISELEIQILQIDSRRIEQAEDQARAVGAQANLARERLASIRERLGRTEVRAPVSGEVFGTTVFAPGEVVRPGEAILQIVPADSRLTVMARIRPTDVDQVFSGQAAVLRFSAFPARKTPEFEGRVVRVSADAARDPETGLSWYEVELSMDRPAADAAAAAPAGRAPDRRRLFGDLPVTPGMPVEVHIRTAERSVIGYLVKPVTDFFRRALREE